jgi:hypothetical protein
LAALLIHVNGLCDPSIPELVEHLQDTIESLEREIARNRKSDEYRKAIKGTRERLTVAKQILAREEARASRLP